MSSNDKGVIITGASAGLGRALARAFGKRGARIGLISRNQERLQDAAKEVEELGGKAIILPADVADANQIFQAAETFEKEMGSIDIWVNNAMVSVFSPIMQMTPEEYKRVTEVTYLGFVHGSLAALKVMQPRNAGMIVQVGSALAYRAIPLQSAYSAAKHAVRGFTESLRAELIHDKSAIKITMVQLPGMNTTQFGWVKNKMPQKQMPVPPIYQPEVAAEAIVYATQHYRREWHVGYMTTMVIEGNKLAPWLGDLYLSKKGYDSQMYDGAPDPEQPNSLFETVPGNFGARGPFSDQAVSFSPLLWVNQRRFSLFLLFVGLVLFLLFF